MRNPILLLASFLFLFLLNACHRPYALVQRTPTPRYQTPPPASVVQAEKSETESTRPTLAVLADSVAEDRPQTNLALASTAPLVAAPTARMVARRVARVENMVRASTSVVTEQPRPRPKAKNDLRLGNRIRQSLGLPLREELNWWQRIDWKIKASVFVIGVAILFAILNLGQLALIFGLIGAVLLVLGLKRSFKKRRPWL